MLAAYVQVKKGVELRHIEKAEPKGREVVLKILGCGVCGSDFLDAKVWAKTEKRLGHEYVGVVDAIGPEVKTVQVGDQAVVALSAPCGECLACSGGRIRQCSSILEAEQGGFGEYVHLRDERLVHAVNPKLDPLKAVLVEPLTVALDAIHLSNVTRDDAVLVVGGGFIAKIALLALRAGNLLEAESLFWLSRKKRKAGPDLAELVQARRHVWKTRFGATKAAPDALFADLERCGRRVVVIHTAPPRYIGLYIDRLPFNSVVVNLGLAAKAKDNRLILDMDKLLFRRKQLLSGFPVPCLHLPEAVELLRKRPDLFAALDVRTAPLDELTRIVKKGKRVGDKLVILPKPLDQPERQG